MGQEVSALLLVILGWFSRIVLRRRKTEEAIFYNVKHELSDTPLLLEYYTLRFGGQLRK